MRWRAARVSLDDARLTVSNGRQPLLSCRAVKIPRQMFAFAVLVTKFLGASAGSVTGILPTSITAGVATDITLQGTMDAGDQVMWLDNSGTCTGQNPELATNAGTDQVNSFTVASVGTYMLCYDSAGGGTSAEQTGFTLTVVAATPSNTITAIIGTGIHNGNAGTTAINAAEADDVQLTGTVAAGDLVIWATSCTGTTPNVDPTDGVDQSTTYTVATAGSYKLCYRKAGGSDSVEQSGITLTVNAAAVGAGSDPVVVYNGQRKMIWLPIHVPHLLLRTGSLSVFATTFPGNVHEQWFDRITVSFNGNEVFQVSIKKNILDFNRTRSAPTAPETLDIRLGGQRLDRMPISGGFLKAETPDAPLSVYLMKMNRKSRSSLIGKACRELVQVDTPEVNLLIWASPADEYYGNLAHFASKYAHLDLEVRELKTPGASSGILPEVAGFRPTSPFVEGLTKSCPTEAPLDTFGGRNQQRS